MKRIILALSLCLLFLLSYSQTAIPYVGMSGEIVTFPTGTGSYTTTINVSDFTGIFNGNNISVNHVLWKGCGRYVITTINSQFPGEVNITFSDPDGNGNPGTGFCVLLNETDIAKNGHFVASGGEFTLQTENQCMGAYYAEELIGGGGGGGLDSLTNVAGDTIVNGDVIVAASDSTINYVTPTQLKDSLDAITITGTGEAVVTGNYSEGFNVDVRPDSIYRYSVTNGSSITGSIKANGPGVSLSDGGQGELIVSIPDSVEIEDFSFVFPSSYTNSNALYVIFDYQGAREFNTNIYNIEPPVVRLENATSISSPNRTIPDFSDGANTSKSGKYGVSAWGGGDGSDIEITVLDAAQASNTFITMKF